MYAFYNFINSVIEESNHCTEVMKNHFNKELVMTDNEHFNDNDNEHFKNLILRT